MFNIFIPTLLSLTRGAFLMAKEVLSFHFALHTFLLGFSIVGLIGFASGGLLGFTSVSGLLGVYVLPSLTECLISVDSYLPLAR